MNIFSALNIFKKTDKTKLNSTQKSKLRCKNLEPLKKDTLTLSNSLDNIAKANEKQNKNSTKRYEETPQQLELKEKVLNDENIKENKSAQNLALQLISRADSDEKIDFVKFLYDEKKIIQLIR